MQSCAELEQQGYKSLLEGAFVLVCDRDEQHLVQVKACHPDHNMQPVLTIQVIQHLHAKVVGGLRIFQMHPCLCCGIPAPKLVCKSNMQEALSLAS